MPDYDVEAVALSSPPASAVMTPYRPAVLVRNNGVHDALASGYIRIYSAGLLIFTTEVYSGTIAPGATGLAQAVDYWTPPAEGKYIANGYVSCPLDQYEPNNNLGPSTFTVTGGPTPPPPTVPIHAAQHEEGGTDEVSIDGLKGLAADEQTPRPHVATHQAGGSDQLNVGALQGELASPQTPKTHSNAYHDPAFATASALSSHQAAATVHTTASNLANRILSGEDQGLVDILQLGKGSEPGGTPQNHFLALDRIWRIPTAAAASLGANAEPIELDGPDGGVTLLILQVPIAWITKSMQFLIQLKGYLHTLAATGATLHLGLWLGQAGLGELDIPAEAISDLDFTISADITGSLANVARGAMSFLSSGLLPNDVRLQQSEGNTLFVLPTEDSSISVTASFYNAHLETYLELTSGFIRALHQPA
jgi:hypothetical protein